MRGNWLESSKKIFRYSFIFLALTGLLFTSARYGNPSKSLADFTQAGPVQITSCDNILSQLNLVHPHNVAKINNCFVDSEGNITAQIEFTLVKVIPGVIYTIPTGWKLWSECAALYPQNREKGAICGNPGQYNGFEISNMDHSAFNKSFRECQNAPGVTTGGPNNSWNCSSNISNNKDGSYNYTKRAFVSFHGSGLRLILTGSLNQDKTATLKWNCLIIGGTCDASNNLTLDQDIGKVAAPSGTYTTSKPLAQNTTYTLTATDKAGKQVTASATVTLPGAGTPDLTIDMSGITLHYVDAYVLGERAVNTLTQAPFLVGNDTAEASFDNVIVKNIGSGVANGNISAKFSMCGNTSDSSSYVNPSSKQVSLEPGASLTLDQSAWFGSFPKRNFFLSTIGAKQTQNSCALNAKLTFTPSLGQADETNKSNNENKLDKFVNWPTVNVTVKSTGSPVAGAVVDFNANNSEVGNERRQSVTDESGNGGIITPAPRKGAVTYVLSVTVGDIEMGGEQKVAVSSPVNYPASFNLGGFVSVRPVLTVDMNYSNPGKPLVTSAHSGSITISRRASGTGSGSNNNGGPLILNDRATNSQPNIVLTQTVKMGLAVFTKEEFPNFVDGTYDIQPSSAMLFSAMRGLKGYNADYQWPEKTRSSLNPPQSFVVKSGTFHNENLKMYLAEDCQLNEVINTKICIYDDAEDSAKIKTNVIPAVIKNISVLGSLPEASKLTAIYIGFTMSPQLGGYYAASVRSIYFDRDSSYYPGAIDSLAPHEYMHFLDDSWVTGDKWLSSTNADYMKSIDSQIGLLGGPTGTDGQKLWDIVSFGKGYGSVEGGYNSNALAARPNEFGKHIEAFATELTTMYKLGPKAMMARLDNIDDLWQTNYHTVPPAGLPALVTNVRNRLQGKFADSSGNYTITIPLLADYYKLCSNITY